MIVTEEEAICLWCPMASDRDNTFGKHQGCIGKFCMLFEAEGGELRGEGRDEKPVEVFKCGLSK